MTPAEKHSVAKDACNILLIATVDCRTALEVRMEIHRLRDLSAQAELAALKAERLLHVRQEEA